MYNFIRNMDFRTLNMLIRFYSLARKSHYDVLRLRKNCTDKEIKEAFIKLSKEYHPDINKDSNAQQHFVRIVEAYNVLGKPNSRALYDNTTKINMSQNFYNTYDMYNMKHTTRARDFYGGYARRTSEQSSGKQEDPPYYGVKGIKKVPNYVLILLCVGIAFVGTVLQAIVIRELYVVHKKKMLEQSRYLAEELDRVKTSAQENTNEVQTRILLEKIVGSSNPTIATASLGQALATEKK